VIMLSGLEWSNDLTQDDGTSGAGPRDPGLTGLMKWVSAPRRNDAARPVRWWPGLPAVSGADGAALVASPHDVWGLPEPRN